MRYLHLTSILLSHRCPPLSGSGLTRRQRALVIIFIVIVCRRSAVLVQIAQRLGTLHACNSIGRRKEGTRVWVVSRRWSAHKARGQLVARSADTGTGGLGLRTGLVWLCVRVAALGSRRELLLVLSCEVGAVCVAQNREELFACEPPGLWISAFSCIGGGDRNRTGGETPKAGEGMSDERQQATRQAGGTHRPIHCPGRCAAARQSSRSRTCRP